MEEHEIDFGGLLLTVPNPCKGFSQIVHFSWTSGGFAQKPPKVEKFLYCGKTCRRIRTPFHRGVARGPPHISLPYGRPRISSWSCAVTRRKLEFLEFRFSEKVENWSAHPDGSFERI
jgi:hypothetical protein